jgi:SNF2 family DNA or RNA helicase
MQPICRVHESWRKRAEPYDLPWNPQRIEQRIGHRYSQKRDVTVVNFIANG